MDSVLAPAECFGVVVMLGTRPQKKMFEREEK